MNERDIAFLPAWQLGRLIKTKEISPVELTELYIRRIEEFNPALNAFITIAADYAIREAKLAEIKITNNDITSALFGVPIGIKDLELTSGIRSTMGSLVYQNYIPELKQYIPFHSLPNRISLWQKISLFCLSNCEELVWVTHRER